MFSTGLLSLVNTLLAGNFFTYLIFSAIISIIANVIIDRLGHKEVFTRYGQTPVRTPLTHTLPRSVLWGIVSIIPILALLFLSNNLQFFVTIGNNYLILIDGIIVGPSHMLLDVFTEKGIYVKRNGKWRRYALAHYRYDNPFVNGLAIIVGVLLLFLSYSLSNRVL